MASKTRLQTKFQLRQQERREQIEQRRMLMSQESVTRNVARSENSYSGGVDVSKMFEFADNGSRMAGSKTALNQPGRPSLQKLLDSYKKPSVEPETAPNSKDPFYPYFGRNGITPPNNGEAYPGEFAGTPSPDMVKTNPSSKKNKVANDIAKNRFAAGDSKSNNNRTPLINQVKPKPVVAKKSVTEPKSPKKLEIPKKTPQTAALKSPTKPPTKPTARAPPNTVSKTLNKSAPNISKSPRKLPAKIPKNMAPCKSCNRLFNVFRVERHELICEKTEALRKTRVPYDGSKHRLKGTVVEQYLHTKDGSGDEPANQGIEGSTATKTGVPVTASYKPPIQANSDPVTRLPAGENRPPSAHSTTAPKGSPPKRLSEQKSGTSRRSFGPKKTYEQFIKDMRVQYKDVLAPPVREPTEA